jgi:hypothetical protein
MALKSISVDQLTPYEKAIWQVFEPITKWKTPHVRYEFVFDKVNQQYQVVSSGWDNDQRLYGILIHIAIRGEYLWLETDDTKLDVAEQLVEYGVPKDKIILGYYPPSHVIDGFADPTSL